jgi:hypothetical protein
MGHGKDELVANTIYAYCTANNFHSCVLGVIEDEMISVEIRQQAAPDTTSNLRWFSQCIRQQRGIQGEQLECG